jgi:hypothetical protein
LFSPLAGDAPPSLSPLSRRGGQMRIRAARDERYDPRHSKFRALFDRPLHAVKFVYRENQGNISHTNCRNYLAQVKLDAVVFHQRDSPAANALPGGYIEIFSDASTQHADQVIRVLSNQCGAIPGDFVSNPAASGHDFGGWQRVRQPKCCGTRESA